MPEIGTSGSMSEDEKRSDATWPQRPRSSSTLPTSEVKADVHSRRIVPISEVKEPPTEAPYLSVEPSCFERSSARLASFS
jgi:hypothetical protein